MKRLISLLLALFLILPPAFSMNVYAQEEKVQISGGLLELNDALSALIEHARAIERGNYTIGSWNALQTAIADSEFYVKFTIDRTVILEQTAKLQAAIDGLFDPTELKALLSALVEEASAIERGEYRTDSWNALQAAIQNAQTVLRDANATKEQIDGLVDTAAFRAKYEEAQKIDGYKHTKASREAINEAMSIAWSMYHAATTQQQLDELIVFLQKAIDEMVEIASLDALSNHAVRFFYMDCYTEASRNALAVAISNARTVTGTANATKTQVEEQFAALQKALDELVEMDTTALKALIEQAEAIKKGNYTDASWNALRTALDAARAVCKNAASQQQVDEQLALLQKAIDGLAEKMPLALNQSELALNYRGTAQLSVTSAEGKVTWSSSNDKVSVSQNGQVTSKYIFGGKKAQAVITAKDSITGQSTSCAVNVAPTALQWVLIVVLFGWIWL